MRQLDALPAVRCVHNFNVFSCQRLTSRLSVFPSSTVRKIMYLELYVRWEFMFSFVVVLLHAFCMPK